MGSPFGHGYRDGAPISNIHYNSTTNSIHIQNITTDANVAAIHIVDVFDEIEIQTETDCYLNLHRYGYDNPMARVYYDGAPVFVHVGPDQAFINFTATTSGDYSIQPFDDLSVYPETDIINVNIMNMNNYEHE